jgi:hypothetical protein
MDDRPRLSKTQIMMRKEGTGQLVTAYGVQLAGGGVLTVRMPAALTEREAIEIVDHLRELAYAVGASAGLPEQEAAAREELLRGCQEFQCALRGVRDPERAQQMLDGCGYLIEALIEFLRFRAS